MTVISDITDAIPAVARPHDVEVAAKAALAQSVAIGTALPAIITSARAKGLTNDGPRVIANGVYGKAG